MSRRTRSSKSSTQAAKKQKTENAIELLDGWNAHGETDVYFKEYGTKTIASDTISIGAFDLDWTIIKTKSGNKFPKNKDDWQFWDPSVIVCLKQCEQEKDMVVIFSNQNGVNAGKVTLNGVCAKFDAIVAQVGLKHCWVFFSTAKASMFRKPAKGMFTLFCEQVEKENIKVSAENSFYVGDAAGRVYSAKKKDFASSDLKFARNIGFTFFTPESYFLQSKETLHTEFPKLGDGKLGFDPRKYLDAEPVELPQPITEGQELVICVGSPASGKSSFLKQFFSMYSIVNQDTLGTRKKCVQMCQKELEAGKSVAIDNTNSKASVRSEYIEVAKSLNIPIRCLLFEREVGHASHVNEFRKITPYQEQRHIPGIALNMFIKHYEKPTLDEGFVKIEDVPFSLRKGDFANDEELNLFTQFIK